MNVIFKVLVFAGFASASSMSTPAATEAQCNAVAPGSHCATPTSPAAARDGSGYGDPFAFFIRHSAKRHLGADDANSGSTAVMPTEFAPEHGLSRSTGQVGIGSREDSGDPGIAHPSTYALMALCLAGVAAISRRRRND
jgi:hypothetical protein